MSSKARHQVSPIDDADDSSTDVSKKQNPPASANKQPLPQTASAQESKLSPTTGQRKIPKGTAFGTTLDAKVGLIVCL